MATSYAPAVDAKPSTRRGRVLRYSRSDSALIALSLLYGAAILWTPSVFLIALGLWWTANTVAHNFIHLPFFRARPLNRVFSGYLSLLMGVPQSLWRSRHLAHHAGSAHHIRWTPQLLFESSLVLALWVTLALVSPRGFFLVYLPGWAIGLGLCQLQGHFEHASGTTSHYGRFYNTLFFNDGYHVEHHARPLTHWTGLRSMRAIRTTESSWPPVLRWLDVVSLNQLERLVLRSHALQRVVLAAHVRALETMLREVGPVGRVTVVGGGLYPRTALALRRVVPDAQLTLLDVSTEHLQIARTFLGDTVTYRQTLFDGRAMPEADLLVVPLAYIGERRALYDRPPVAPVLIHDWIWSRRGRSVVVAWWLLKRLNLVRGSRACAAAQPVQRSA